MSHADIICCALTSRDLAQHAAPQKGNVRLGRNIAFDFYRNDITRLIKSNHNLTNQNWNKMVGRRRPAAAAGGRRRINSRRPASPRGHAGIIIDEPAYSALKLKKARQGSLKRTIADNVCPTLVVQSESIETRA
jgi:hypothetical protein